MSDEIEFADALIQRQFARLTEQAGRYIGAMRDADREAVLENALSILRSNWAKFGPPKRPLLTYWDACLRVAIGSKPSWQVRRFDRWETWNVKPMRLEAILK